ncbi:WD40 domain-containing protein [Nitrospira japonica]|nr:caspase family protein [Nitrospira japonica]
MIMIVFLLLSFAGCAMAPSYGRGGPSRGDFQPPSEADMQKMMGQMMGQAPVRHAPVSTDGVQVVFQTGHAGAIHAVAVSPNGRYLASSGSQDGTVKIWDVASGQEVRNFSGFGGFGQGADFVTFSEDSTQVVTHEMTGAVKVFDVASGREVRAGGAGLDGRGAVSANGRFAAVGEAADPKSSDSPLFGGNRSLSIIDLGTGRTVWTIPDSAMQQPLAFSRDGRTLVTVRTDTGHSSTGVIGTIGSSLGSMIGLGGLFSNEPSIPAVKQELLVWEVPAKTQRHTWPYAPASDGLGGTLSPDGRYFAMEQPVERSLRVLDLETGKPVVAIRLGETGMKGMGMTHSLTFNPDGTLLAIGKGDGAATLFEFPSGKKVREFDATSLNFSPDGATWVIGAANGGAPYLQDAASGKETRLAGGASEVSDLALTADGQSIVAGMHGGSAKLWNLPTGQLVRTFDCPDGMAVSSVAVSRAGTLLATGCINGSAWLWDLATGKQLKALTRPLPPDQFTPVYLRLTRDDRTAIIGRGNQVIVADVSNGMELSRIILPNKSVKGIAHLENQSAAYEGLDPKTRAMMDAQAPKQPSIDRQTLERMKESAQWIRALDVHPGGKLIAIGRSESTSLWDVQTGKLVLEFRDVSPMQARAMQQRQREEEYQRMIEEAGSLKSLLPFGLGAPSRSMSMPQGEIRTLDDPSELFEAFEDGTHGATSLAFSPDGKFLATDGVRGKTVWDVVTGKKVHVPKRQMRGAQFDPMSVVENLEMNIGGRGAAFSPDGRIAARGHGQIIKVWNVATGQDVLQLVGHTGAISSLVFSPDGRFIVSAGGDGAIRLWSLRSGKEVASLIALGHEDFVAVTPDQYYRASKSRIKGVAFRVNDQLYPFEQFDLRFNRPDIVLERLGMASPDLVKSYRLAYEKRLRKMGLNDQMLGIDFHLPELHIQGGEVPVSIDRATLPLRVKAMDTKYALDRLQVYVNDVPVYGTSGLMIADRTARSYEQEIQVPLVAGRNKIQVSVLNQQGTESLRETLYTTSTAEMAPPDIYLVGIGVSEYKNRAYNLRYAAKDANDLLALYKSVEARSGVKGNVHLLDLTNEKATRPEIRKAKDWLKRSKANDLVIVFAAGHGMTDEQSNYYFGTHDIDPKHPAVNGLPYEEFERLLDGIPALQKMLLLDTCFSGEIEKDQPVVVAKADAGGSGTVKMRSFKAARGVTLVADAGDGQANTPAEPRLSTDMVKFQQDWFADLRRGTGAAVISSSSGNEYSLEGEQWKNGVFTYALLNGLKNQVADTNKDRTVTVSELQGYVIEQVRKLTEGGQNPTARRENLEYDFAVY